jgi:hypothetical protein
MEKRFQSAGISDDVTVVTENITPENAEIRRDVIETNVCEVSEVPRPPISPALPVVAGKLLHGGHIHFIDFLHDDHCKAYCAFLFPDGTSGATMLAELRKGTHSYYYGPRTSRTPWNAGKLDRLNSATKALLRAFANLAYRGDGEGRDIKYWERIAALVWNVYSDLMARRNQSALIVKRETNRLVSLPRKRAAAAERARRSRKKRAVRRS